MIIKPNISHIDVLVRELLEDIQKNKDEIKNSILNGFKTDSPSLDRHTYLHRNHINRENRETLEIIRRIEKLLKHLEGARSGLNIIGDILLTMIEICEDASAVYMGEVTPKFIEHNVHLTRLKNEFYSIVKLYKTGDLPVFVTVNSNTSGTVNVDYNIHLDSNNTTRLFYESPKIMDETTAKNGVAANRPILSIDRLFYSSELVYITPNIINDTISTNIYSNNITLLEECITRINNYKNELKKLTLRLELRKTQLEGSLELNRDIRKRDIETNRDIEERISNNRYLMKKTEYNI